MALDTNVLRTILMYLGIKDLQIHFEPGNSSIQVQYKFYGNQHRKILTFQEIEQLFTPSGTASVRQGQGDHTSEVSTGSPQEG